MSDFNLLNKKNEIKRKSTQKCPLVLQNNGPVMKNKRPPLGFQRPPWASPYSSWPGRKNNTKNVQKKAWIHKAEQKEYENRKNLNSDFEHSKPVGQSSKVKDRMHVFLPQKWFRSFSKPPAPAWVLQYSLATSRPRIGTSQQPLAGIENKAPNDPQEISVNHLFAEGWQTCSF